MLLQLMMVVWIGEWGEEEGGEKIGRERKRGLREIISMNTYENYFFQIHVMLHVMAFDGWIEV